MPFERQYIGAPLATAITVAALSGCATPAQHYQHALDYTGNPNAAVMLEMQRRQQIMDAGALLYGLSRQPRLGATCVRTGTITQCF